MKNITYILLGLILALSLTNCQPEDEAASAAIEYANQRLTDINDHWQATTIDIAEALNKPKASLNKQGATIITYYDADCSSCLMDLEKWKTTLMPYFKAANPQVEFRFVLKTDDRRILEYNLQQIGIPKEYVIIDTNDQFLKTFDFANEKAFNTFLVNAKKEVLFIGSPLISENLRKHYANQITS